MTTIVTPVIPGKDNLLKNYFHVIGVYGALWIIFHLTIVFFFGFIVGSPLLVGIFLGLGNLWSMCIDVPLGTIQRHIQTKTMFGISNACMIIAAILLLYLVTTSDGIGFSLRGNIFEVTREFLSTGFNFLILLLIGLLYGTIKEIYDVTSTSYLLNHADPDEYDTVLSKNDIALGIGMVSGIVLSIIILGLRTNSTQLILFVLIFCIVIHWILMQRFFDNDHEIMDLQTIRELTISQKNTTSTNDETTKKTISTADFQNLKKGLDYIIMEPKNIVQKLDWGDIYKKTKEEFRMLWILILNKESFVPMILWTTGCIMLFGCWDTIVTTFFITYIDTSLQNSGIQNIIRSGYILIGILAIPAYALQMFWIKKADQYGKFSIITFGTFLSAVALFGLGITGNLEGIGALIIVVLLGMLNSTGYAAGYPMSQSIFADEYNKAYAKKTGATVISADISAAPLKILNNFANAVGLMLGGALISFMGYAGMFIIYGILVLAWGIVSVRKKESWNLKI